MNLRLDKDEGAETAGPRTARKPVRPTMVDKATRSVRDGIFRGRYAPGQRLVEADLMQELSASRGIVREALRRLASEGLVAIEPYRGAVVERLTRQRLDCYFEIIEALEGMAARRAAERFGELGAAAPKAARTLHELADHGSDRGRFIERNILFHDYVVELSGNRLLPDLRSRLQTPALRIHFPTLLDEADIAQSDRDHRAIVEAITKPDPDRAETLMRRHVRRTAQISHRLPDYLFSGADS